MTDGPVAEAAAVEAVVVDFHAGARLARCIESLRSEGCRAVVVVDNSTSGATRTALAGPQGAPAEVDLIIESDANRGFGAGVNAGVARTSAPFVLACNPDVELRPGALACLLACLGSGVAVVAPALLDEAGRTRPGPRPLPTLRSSWLHAFVGVLAPGSTAARRHRQRQAEQLASGQACWVPGACLLFRREAFSAVGGFDESYFLYLEEVDLCRRLGESGWRIAYEPAAVAVHSGGASTSRRPLRSVAAYHRSLWRYLRSTSSGPERIALPLAAAAIGLRGVVAAAVSLLGPSRSVLSAPATGDAEGTDEARRPNAETNRRRKGGRATRVR
ncbi:MAG TPA: glycosyltransferase family 2 protein [Acidimicrobiales bacterium]|nr:glycosyltransferase family 2 protein [Acidimicrobiales bacterium]